MIMNMKKSHFRNFSIIAFNEGKKSAIKKIGRHKNPYDKKDNKIKFDSWLFGYNYIFYEFYDFMQIENQEIQGELF